MITDIYPLHDMNVVFDIFEETLRGGDVHENAGKELSMLNKLFSKLPAQAVEYGMEYLHGAKDTPLSCADIMPLFIRFRSFGEYCAKIRLLREIPAELTTEEIMARHEMMNSLDEHEKHFLVPIMGISYNAHGNEVEAESDSGETTSESDSSDSSSLHLMNASAMVWGCSDPLKTALFYEQKCAFRAVHLEDEAMPHIRLSRDNVVIILVKADDARPASELFGLPYDLYIYVSEPFMLYNELQNTGVNITEELLPAESSIHSSTNRQFAFEDCDRRRICVSLSTEV